MSRIPEYRVVGDMGRYFVEDEYGEGPAVVYDWYHDALIAAAGLIKEAVDSYDGGEP